jgi:predicted MFS family arabinose efflux permease
LGRYKAQLQAGYGTTGNALMATLFFWVIPWRLIVLVLTIIAIMVCLSYLLRNPPKPTPSPRAEKLEKELETLRKKYKDK